MQRNIYEKTQRPNENVEADLSAKEPDIVVDSNNEIIFRNKQRKRPNTTTLEKFRVRVVVRSRRHDEEGFQQVMNTVESFEESMFVQCGHLRERP